MKHTTVHKARVHLPATLFAAMFKTSSILPAFHLQPCDIMWKQTIACQEKQPNSHPNALRHTNLAKMTCQSSKWVSEECHRTVANIININTTHSSASSYMKPDFPSSFNLSLSVQLVLREPADWSRWELDDSKVQTWKQLHSTTEQKCPW